ncbi:trihelix transcription factor DF1-like [Actinidia eriantha]|uniref:trihelix transcription factor DF1-like n=1 Tax=Actinidia eriantha TaxID=165200 RepID=UPI0025832C23|nr:trihelix transcription factor DF1-like [Actinidia eriantha]
MLGVSGMLGTSGDGGELGGADGFSEEDKLRIEEGERNSAGNRWPRQETLALLQIRSDMDVAFRDSNLKGPLWEEVSRKLSELGYHRSAKKCKEKFENVYKYHRRTKEGRVSKPDGKTYRFFDQLEALENQAPPVPPLPPPPRPQTHPATNLAVAMPAANTIPPIFTHLTVPSTTGPISGPQSTTIISTISPQPPPPETTIAATISADPISFSFHGGIAPSHLNMPVNLGSMSMSMSSSSSTSSDEEPERHRKRKRKWTDFFQRLMNKVVEKQEEMQKRFIESLERRERDRVAREEAWRAQEIARMNREHDLLVHERSMAAAKDAAVIAFLQKVSEQQVPSAPSVQMLNNSQPRPPKPTPLPQSQPELEIPQPPQPQPQPPPQLLVQVQVPPPPKSPKTDNNRGENIISSITSSSRWPKAEVQALIRLRTNMDLKYQENCPKGPLWEEISSAMRKIGYDRNARRCKEKWENINKYFKKVKESNKKRPEDSKTCPYFHDLDVLYREKAKNETTNNLGSGFGVKMENPMAPIMVQPEQQWPLPQQQPESAVEDEESDQNNEGDHESDDDEDEDEDDDEVGGYEIVANKPSSVGAVE